ncbi:hypothetical protein Q1695_007872 [Nippostrongylus brasiliensis]|nr:hypothetical protein Q1695_007872 [Nippostrongylus brasiliensis]
MDVNTGIYKHHNSGDFHEHGANLYDDFFDHDYEFNGKNIHRNASHSDVDHGEGNNNYSTIDNNFWNSDCSGYHLNQHRGPNDGVFDNGFGRHKLFYGSIDVRNYGSRNDCIDLPDLFNRIDCIDHLDLLNCIIYFKVITLIKFDDFWFDGGPFYLRIDIDHS